MKKVICVDADGVILTQMKEYEVQEMSYSLLRVKCDDGCVRDYPSIRFRPVPEQEFQYGQEVEFFGGSEKVVFCCIDPDFHNIAIIKRYDMMLTKVDRVSLSDIRPVQSMRERVIEELMRVGHADTSDIADRIIEIVKNEKG